MKKIKKFSIKGLDNNHPANNLFNKYMKKYKCENCNDTEVKNKGEWCDDCNLPERGII